MSRQLKCKGSVLSQMSKSVGHHQQVAQDLETLRSRIPGNNTWAARKGLLTTKEQQATPISHDVLEDQQSQQTREEEKNKGLILNAAKACENKGEVRTRKGTTDSGLI